MLKKDLILRSPAENVIGIENITQGKFGAVLSRAGVGKTSFLVQIALTQLLADEKIVHISLDDSMEKVNLRYDEAYNNLVESIGYVDPQKAVRLWEAVKHNKVGISYTDTSFDVVKIREYLKSFKKADLAMPTVLVIDGLDFDSDLTDTLVDLDQVNKDFGIAIWLSMQIHREEAFTDDGFPVQLSNHKDRIDKAIYLKPVENKILAVILKDGDKTNQEYTLDPATMMLTE